MNEKRIVLTGGGTAGHVTPNLALLPGLRELGYSIYYIGSVNGIEKELSEREGLPYYPIQTGKLRRYLDLKNLTDAFRVVRGLFQALSALRKIKPEVVFSKGGFVSCPVVWAAWLRRIPVVIHESDMTPGLTNKLSMPFARKVCYSFPESAKYFSGNKGELTGLPVRMSLLSGNKDNGLRLCGFTGEKPVMLVIGGSQGSEAINSIVRETLSEIGRTFDICHICGKGNMKNSDEAEDVDYSGNQGYTQFEYVNEELADLFAMADVFVSRAGATVLFEILALQKPALLIPLSKRVSRGDQILNAGSFEKSGFSCVIQEEDLGRDIFIEKVSMLLKNGYLYKEAMRNNGRGSANEAVLKVIKDISA
ncbi:MAG: undecaprenyldiphospho-muramoylpentapeptide beta-N-acetylglucosaminyltransferase [Clostridiales bacterium]|nr:undecaprenyldiphospho-muramoylpentapeptide beta-N-acetylglucosaminyltransferase [Clostridiales bacterium]